MAQRIAQRHLRYLVKGDGQILGYPLHAFVHFALAVVAEIAILEVALREDRLRRHLPTQASLIEWDAHDDADVMLLAGRVQAVFRTLIEDVMDNLHGVHDARLHKLQSAIRLMVVDRYAEVT